MFHSLKDEIKRSSFLHTAVHTALWLQILWITALIKTVSQQHCHVLHSTHSQRAIILCYVVSHWRFQVYLAPYFIIAIACSLNIARTWLRLSCDGCERRHIAFKNSSRGINQANLPHAVGPQRHTRLLCQATKRLSGAEASMGMSLEGGIVQWQ